MRTKNYQQIEVPYRLLLEFDFITVGELSNILRNYGALLRSAWRDTYQKTQFHDSPNSRLITTSASTQHSFELVTQYAIPALFFSTQFLGPVKDWPSIARATFENIISKWSRLARRTEARGSGEVFIQGGATPQLQIPLYALENDDLANRITALWAIAQSGKISLTVELPNEDERATYRVN